jgi:hypothetical protein
MMANASSNDLITFILIWFWFVVYGAIPLPDACKNDVFGLKKAGKWLMQREVNCLFFYCLLREDLCGFHNLEEEFKFRKFCSSLIL